MNGDSVYLWTVPLFHCQRLVLPLGSHRRRRNPVCLRKVDSDLHLGSH